INAKYQLNISPQTKQHQVLPALPSSLRLFSEVENLINIQGLKSQITKPYLRHILLFVIPAQVGMTHKMFLHPA
ncbi:MAG TPA: hypothetical protein VIJ25_18870, partial [Methylococcales bacterium]